MMKLKGNVTISKRNHMGDHLMAIRIQDKNSNQSFVEITITMEDFAQAVTGLAHVPCDMQVRGLDVVGKEKEQKELVFEIPKDLSYSMKKESGINEKGGINEIAKKATDKGWKPSLYFRSQNSFFSKDGKDYARTSQFRFVEVIDE